ncbi:uncharacterized protein Dsimw501_GD28550 [Drosophila simulans]|nr:uncharacterized protein Dsimw501_GD28550 [Drosophila simulans]
MAKSQKRTKRMLVYRQTINKSKSYRKRQAAKGKPEERPITRQQAGSPASNQRIEQDGRQAKEIRCFMTLKGNHASHPSH